MASPCIYTINGEKKSFEEYIDMLANMDDAEIDGLIEKGKSQIEKTITKKRAFDASQNEDLKDSLKKYGLTRYIESQDEVLSNAQSFLNEVGVDVAIDALRNNKDLPASSKTALWGKLMIATTEMIGQSKTAQEYDEAIQKRAEVTNLGDLQGLDFGRGASMYNAVYKDFEKYGLDFNTDKLVKDKIEEFKNEYGVIPESIKKKFEELGEQIKATNKELQDANEKLKQKEAHIAILELQDAGQRESTEKAIATRKQAAKKKVNDGLSEMFGALASISGGKLSAVDSDEQFVRGARKAIEGFMEEASITFEEAFEKLRGAVKTKGYDTKKIDSVKEDLQKDIEQEGKQESLFGLGSKKLRELAKKVDMGKNTTPEQQVEQYVSLIKSQLPKKYEGISDREIRDGISGYGKIITQSKEEGQLELSKLKNLFRGVSQLEDISNGEPPKKSGFQRPPTDEDVRTIYRRVREALKTLPLDQETREGLLKTAEQSYLKRLKNRIEDLKKENETKIRVKKEKGQSLDTKDIRDAKDKVSLLEEEQKAIFKEELEKEAREKKLKASKSSLQKRISQLEKKIASNDFSKKAKEKQPIDSERRALILKKEKIMEEFNVASARYARENRTPTKKKIDTAIEITMALQALKTAFDLGLAGVQLIPLLSRSAISDIANARFSVDKSKTITAFNNAFKSFASTEYAQKKLDELRQDPYFEKAKTSGLSIIGTSQEVNEFQNEVIDDFIEKMVKKITKSDKIAEVLNNKAFTRFNTTLGNELRFSVFKKAAIAAEMLGYDTEVNTKQFKDIAGTINSFSGRARVKGLTDNDIARVALFSPKNWASMIKTATPVGLVRFSKMKGDETIEDSAFLNSPARREAAKTLLAMTTAGVAYTMLAAMKYNNDDDDNTWVNLIDPTRSDFMKISTKLKDGSVITSDAFGGRLGILATQAKFIKSFLGEEISSLSGGKRKISPIDVLAEHAGNKLSPLFGTTKEYLTDRVKEYEGKMERIDRFTKKPVDHYERFVGTVDPMAPSDIYHIFKNDPSLFEGMNAILVLGGLANVNEKTEGRKETTNPYVEIKDNKKSKK